MDRKQTIQNEIDKTLQQFERAERLQPNAFLLTRIKAQIASENQVSPKTWALRVLRPALLALIVAANVVTAIAFFSHNEPQYQQDNLSVFAQEFGLQVTTDDPFASNP